MELALPIYQPPLLYQEITPHKVFDVLNPSNYYKVNELLFTYKLKTWLVQYLMQ